MRKPSITLLLLFMFICYSCHKRNPNNFTLISYGFSNFNINGIHYNIYNSKSVYIVAKKWGIKFDSKGCVLNDTMMTFINRNNREAEKNISEKYGENWKEKFNEEVQINNTTK